MEAMSAKPRVLLISTGGTITMVQDRHGGFEPAEDDLPYLRVMPELGDLARIDTLRLANVDSANIEPSFWVEVAEAIADRYENFDGFVITHGTDTMVYTAAALSFFLQGLSKPIVLTGAQVPLVEIGSDARTNLVNAVRAAGSNLSEVCIVFGAFVIRGTRAQKTSAFDLQAFRSVNEIPIGTIGLELQFAPNALMAEDQSLRVSTSLCHEVARIPVWPGIDPTVISTLAHTHSGLVIEGYGLGSLPSDGERSIAPSIEDATKRGVPVVVTTQCILGSTAMGRYHVGRAALDAGAIPALDMTPECAQVKLMWALGQTRDLSEIRDILQRRYVGEIRVPVE